MLQDALTLVLQGDSCIRRWTNSCNTMWIKASTTRWARSSITRWITLVLSCGLTLVLQGRLTKKKDCPSVSHLNINDAYAFFQGSN